ncbi:uncharacterized protein C4orf54 homolog [Genypterus blacodes]|uniref:uncharacterized protein C4orf54 homolog n=1 Tax=Genypterus blacodes TaxID=154954 RepID=UPI003F760E1B
MKTNQSGTDTPARQEIRDLPHKAAAHGGEEAREENTYADLSLETKRGEAKDSLRGRNNISVLINSNKCGKGEEDDTECRCERSSSSATHCLNADNKDVSESAEDNAQNEVPKQGESRCADNYLTRGSESDYEDDYEDDDDDDDDDDDAVTLVLSDNCAPSATEDDSNYITTHEIQLSELSDHEGDYGLGVGSSSWDLEDEHQVYSFVDYAPFAGARAAGETGARCLGAAAAVSTLLESDLCAAAKFSSADEPQQTPRAINDPGNIHDKENVLPWGMSRYGKAEKLCDGAKRFITVPGRAHRGKGKAVTEYSSGGSTALSELDEADKEVRNLTARTFKSLAHSQSLAHPHLDAFHFSTSSESSASERGGIGINKWAAFVNISSQGLDQSLISHHTNHSASFAKNTDNKSYMGIKPPTSKIFPLTGNPSSTQKIELRGKFAQGHSGIIRLTETLNFRCNVNSGMSAGERRGNFAQKASGSRSTDEVTSSLSGQRREERGSKAASAMEEPHKKASFASSLIKNVISKKMQFEQERKMERGEISEPPAPCCAHQEGETHRGKASRELQRQTSRFSETSSDNAIVCVDELGDILDSGSCDAKSQTRTPEANLEAAIEAGIEAKKGASEASKGTLLRSQNSAFRCWRDNEVEFQKDRKSDKPAEENEGDEGRCATGSGKLTKMSHLFVPRIQLLPNEGEGGQQLQNRDYSACEGGEGGIKLRSDNTLYIAHSRDAATSKSPEIKINLRSVNKREAFDASNQDLKCQALAAVPKDESAEKVRHFMVRDIRDNKGKFQTPIHQVRDVRKLVKSSYHFGSLDSNDDNPEQKKQTQHRNSTSVSPIIIKCQSVNTNNDKQSGNLIEVPKCRMREEVDLDRSSPERAICGSAAPQRPPGAGRAPNSNSTEGAAGLRTETRIASVRQEKTSDVAEKKPESRGANQAALAKLQAAVKTMEQLYVFERNEWKRKNKPHPLTDSHVLSLITNEQQGTPEDQGAQDSKMERTDSHPNTKSPLRACGDRDPHKVSQTASSHDDRFVKSLALQAASTTANIAKTTQPNAIIQTPFSNKGVVPKSPKLPLSLRISQSKHDRAETKDHYGSEVERSSQNLYSASADSENYLTLPLTSHANTSRQAASDKTSVYTFTTHSHPASPPGNAGPYTSARGQEDNNQSPRRTSIVMETHSPSASIYHSVPLGISANQPQVYCFSPAITPAPMLDPYQATQRKMLLDPMTGNYYLVDTPVPPATKRLFDPETGQYVDVPMPQSPMTPMTPMPPMTPLTLQMSPMALSTGAYGHTYMLYPGFLPTPSVIPAQTLVQSQMSMQSEAETGEQASSQHTEGVYMESPFYMATGKSPQAHPQSAAYRPAQGICGTKQPVISITSQQGPRIVAPPSFDGTTMSFVVEHR